MSEMQAGDGMLNRMEPETDCDSGRDCGDPPGDWRPEASDDSPQGPQIWGNTSFWKPRLQNGDVLLSRGTNLISLAIVGFSEGTYSHIGIWDETCCRSIDASRSRGIVLLELESLVSQQSVVDIYRLRESTPNLQTQVVDYAHSRIGQPFSNVDTAAAIVASRRFLKTVRKMKSGDRIFWSSVALYLEWRARKLPNDHWHCSEIITRGYDAASHWFDVIVSPIEIKEAAERFGGKYVDVWEELAEDPEFARGTAYYEKGDVVKPICEGIPAPMMSPRHFETSPSFECVGRITGLVRHPRSAIVGGAE